jgi:cytochrome c-type biogenesis protein CcmH
VSARPAGVRPWLPWIAMAVVVVGLLAFGTLGQADRSDAQRAQDLEGTIRCPSCVSQSVANSETPAAKAVKLLIAQRIRQGDSDEEIRDFVASRYGREILLDPSGKGFGALVWGVPVAAAFVAVGALVLRFQDWRPAGVAVTDADRDLVADAMEDHHEPDPAEPVPAEPGADR